jgi:hypothetical protein
MSGRNHDSLDATAHGSLTQCIWGPTSSTVVMERTRSSTLPPSSSSCSVFDRSPQRKSSKIRWIRRVPSHAGRNVNRGRGGLSQSQSQPQSLGEILSLMGTSSRDDKNQGYHNHIFQHQHQSHNHCYGSSRSVLSAGSRVSFAKELVDVIDIPEYDNESISKCFYSNSDLNEFRCEWEMEQDGLIPMQR